MEQILFYVFAAVALLATLLCITEKHPVHAIMYLVTSFFSLAGIFYLFAAPLVAVFEVIIYAGAIMVLFLFIIMMLHQGREEVTASPRWHDWWPATLVGALVLTSLTAITMRTGTLQLETAAIDLRTFATRLFSFYGVAVELISLQLLFALVGALYLARKKQ
jgi:NADH-quinone oxidoreductase subunit J